MASSFKGSKFDIPNPLKATDLDLDLRPVSGLLLSPFRSKLSRLKFEASHIQHFSFLATSPTADGRKLLNPYQSQILNLSQSGNNHDWLNIILILAGDLHQNPGPRPPQISLWYMEKSMYSQNSRSGLWQVQFVVSHKIAMNSLTYRDLVNISWTLVYVHGNTAYMVYLELWLE